MCQAVQSGQPIVVYGDYDVDGVTASTILWHVLKQAGAEVSVYVPHRIEEGYGINNEAITRLAADRPPDYLGGLRNHRNRTSPHRQRSRCGPDHYRPSRLRSVGPRRTAPRCPYACASPLAGIVVSLHGLCMRCGWWRSSWRGHLLNGIADQTGVSESYRDLLLNLLSYVALATVADVVPLVGENRVLTVYGLGQIKRTPFVGA